MRFPGTLVRENLAQKQLGAFVLSILPVVPGFLVIVGAVGPDSFSTFWIDLYSYAWFVTFGLSFLFYYFLTKVSPKAS